MANVQNPEVEVLVGIEGGASISSGSGQLIKNQLNAVTKALKPKVSLEVNKSSLNKIKSDIKTALTSVKFKPTVTVSKKDIQQQFDSFKIKLNINQADLKKQVKSVVESANVKTGTGSTKGSKSSGVASPNVPSVTKTSTDSYKRASDALNELYKTKADIAKLPDDSASGKLKASYITHAAEAQAKYNKELNSGALTEQQRSELAEKRKKQEYEYSNLVLEIERKSAVVAKQKADADDKAAKAAQKEAQKNSYSGANKALETKYSALRDLAYMPVQTKDESVSTLKRRNELQSKISQAEAEYDKQVKSGNISQEQQNELLEKEVQLQKELVTIKEQVAVNKEAQDAKKDKEEKQRSTYKTYSEGNENQIELLKKKLGLISPDNLKSDELTALNAQLEAIESNRRSANTLAEKGLITEEQKIKLLKQEQTIRELTSKIAEKQAEVEKTESLRVASRVKALSEINQLKAQYPALTTNKAYSGEYSRIVSNLGANATAEEIKKASKEIEVLRQNMINNGVIGKSTFEQLTDAAVKFGKAAATVIGTINAASIIRKMVTNVKELDEQITNIAIATGESRHQVSLMADSYHNLAQQIGLTTTEVMSSADAWLRQGFSELDVESLIEATAMLSKLGQIDTDDATKALTSALKGYQLDAENAISVVDKLTAVDMNAAVSAGGIATAMAETSVSANQMGVSMDRLIGYLAKIAEVTQDGEESVGNFFKTLMARMSNIKAGKLIDPETQESLSDVETVLNNYGLALRDKSGQFRNFGMILDEVAEKWETVGSVGQAAIAVAFSGTRQQEKFRVLMENYDEAIALSEIASESGGMASEKYDTYLDSIEAKVNSLTAAAQDLSDSVINSDVFKFIIDGATSVINVLTSAVDVVGAIPLVTAGIGIKNFIKDFKSIKDTINTVGNISSLNFDFNSGAGVDKLAIGMSKLTTSAQEFLAAKKGILPVQQQYISLMQQGLTLEQAKAVVDKNLINTQTKSIALTKQEFISELTNLGVDKQIAAALYEKTVAQNMYTNSLGKNNLSLIDNIRLLWRQQTTLQKIGTGIGLITTVISAASSVYSYFKQKREQAMSEASSEAEELSQSLQTYKDKLSEIYEQYTKGQIDATSYSNQLVEIQTQITDEYGKQNEQISLANQGLQEQYAILEKNASAQWLASNYGSYTEAKNFFEGEYRKSIDGYLYRDFKLTEDQIESTGLKVLMSNAGGHYISSDGLTPEEAYTAFTELFGMAEKSGASDFVLNRISSVINELETKINAQKNVYAQGQYAEMYSDDNAYAKYIEAQNLISAYEQAVASGDSDKIRQYSQLLNNTLYADSNALAQYGYVLSDLQNQVLTITEKQKAAKNAEPQGTSVKAQIGTYSTSDEYISVAEDSYSGKSSALKTLVSAKDKLSYNGNDDLFSDEVFSFDFEKITEEFPNLADEILAVQNALEGSGDATEAWNNLIEAAQGELDNFSAEQFVEAFDAASEALTEHGDGSHQFEQELQGLEDIIPGITNYLVDEEGALLSGGKAAFNSAQDVLTFAEAQISASLAAKGVDLSNAIANYNSLAAAAAGGAIAAAAANASLEGDADVEKMISILNSINAIRSNIGKSSKSSGGGGKSSDYSKEYEQQKEILEHSIEMSELRQHTMEEETDSWKYEQQQQYDYYMKLAQAISKEMDRLKKKGKSSTSEAMMELEEEYQKAINSMYDIQEKAWEAEKEAAIDAIEDQIDAENEKHDALMEQYEAQIDKQEALIDLEEKRYDTIQKLKEEQSELDKEYASARDALVTATNAEKEALFSEADYNELTSVINGLEAEVNALYDDYWAKIQTVNEDNIYMLDYYSNQLENQLSLISQRYEIAKQELAVTRAKIALENTLQERNVAMLVNGKWTWVPDPDSVKTAMEDIYDAEQEQANAQSSYIQQQKITEMEEFQNTLQMQKDAAEAQHDALIEQLEKQRDAIEEMTFSINMFTSGVTTGFNALSGAITNGLSAINSAVSSGYASVVSMANGLKSVSGSSGSSSSSKSSGLNPGGYELANQWWTPWYTDEADRIAKNAEVFEKSGIDYQIVTDEIGRSYITYDGFSQLKESWESAAERLGALEEDATGGMYDKWGYSNNPNYLYDTIGLSRETLNQNSYLSTLSDKVIYEAFTNWGSGYNGTNMYVNSGFGADVSNHSGEGWIAAKPIVDAIAAITGESTTGEGWAGGTAVALKKKKTYSQGGVVDYTGAALVHGSKSSPEMVLNNADVSKLYSFIHNTPDLLSNMFGRLSGKAQSVISNFGQKSVNTDNSRNIYVNGLNVTGSNGDNLISALERVMPTLG